MRVRIWTKVNFITIDRPPARIDRVLWTSVKSPTAVTVMYAESFVKHCCKFWSPPRVTFHPSTSAVISVSGLHSETRIRRPPSATGFRARLEQTYYAFSVPYDTQCNALLSLYSHHQHHRRHRYHHSFGQSFASVRESSSKASSTPSHICRYYELILFTGFDRCSTCLLFQAIVVVLFY